MQRTLRTGRKVIDNPEVLVREQLFKFLSDESIASEECTIPAAQSRGPASAPLHVLPRPCRVPDFDHGAAPTAQVCLKRCRRWANRGYSIFPALIPGGASRIISHHDIQPNLTDHDCPARAAISIRGSCKCSTLIDYCFDCFARIVAAEGFPRMLHYVIVRIRRPRLSILDSILETTLQMNGLFASRSISAIKSEVRV